VVGEVRGERERGEKGREGEMRVLCRHIHLEIYHPVSQPIVGV
jgi:hypothetical protein